MKNLFVITSYPKRGQTHGESTMGVASYTKTTLKNLQKQLPDAHITVWADILDQDIEEVYEEDGMTIKRVWRRADAMSLWYLYQQIQSRNVDQIVIPIDMDMFGNKIHLVLFLSLMTLLRASGHQITSILHQVVIGNVPIRTHHLKRRLLALSKQLFYSIILAVSHDTIVFERAFKAHLERTCMQKRLLELGTKLHFVRKSKKTSVASHQLPTIHVIPHAVEDFRKIPDRTTARKRLRWNPKHRYILCFGFLTAQKGVDQLIQLWEPIKNTHLILAGGELPHTSRNKRYKKFVKKLRDNAQKKGVTITGFVPEKKIATYFAATDVAVLPYTTFRSSSGPLAMAFASETPVIFSEAIGDYFESADFRRALAATELTKREFVFRMSTADFQHTLARMFENVKQAKHFSSLMHEARRWEQVGQSYAQILTR